jgi:hypothetical protein
MDDLLRNMERFPGKEDGLLVNIEASPSRSKQLESSGLDEDCNSPGLRLYQPDDK